MINKRGEIIIIGCRGGIEIQPRMLITKTASVMGVNLFNQTSEERREALKRMNELTQALPELMSPLIDREYALEQVQEAHKEVIAHSKGTFGRILINPDLLYVCYEIDRK